MQPITRTLTRATLAMALVVAAGCKSKSKPTPAPAPTPTTPVVSKYDPELVSQLAVLATGARPTTEELAAAQASPSIEAYIDKLLTDPRVGRDVVSRLTFRELLVTPGFMTTIPSYTLKQTESPGGPIYYLRQPCAANEAVKVKPWWDLKHEALVCPDSYQPDHWVRPAADQRYHGASLLQHCDSHAASPLAEVSPYCGCGPNLLRCYRDAKHVKEIVKSMQNELAQTVGYIVDKDLPASTLFTSQETFHDRNVEFVYRQWQIEDQQLGDGQMLASLEDWPADGKWAPRPEWVPGQHAGVITAPRLLHEHADRRQRMRDIYDKLWCSKPQSVGASAQMVLALKARSFQIQQEAWKTLAERPLCTDCHARLDYSWQFMIGWGDTRAVANHFVSAMQPKGDGPFYGKDISDKRGEAPLNTQAMAQLAVTQPEFGKCMVGNVGRHVFGHRVSDDDLSAMEKAWTDKPTFKTLMRVALNRFAANWKSLPPSLAERPGAAATAPSDKITLTGSLREAVEKYCTDCHAPDGDAKEWNFEPATLPRRMVIRMLDQLSWSRMPPDGIEASARVAIANDFIDAIWQDKEARALAVQHFLGRDEALPTHGPAFSRQVIDSLVGNGAASKPHDEWTLIEDALGADEITFTPGFGAFVGLEALDRCKAAGQTGAALETCLERATDPTMFAKGRVPTP